MGTSNSMTNHADSTVISETIQTVFNNKVGASAPDSLMDLASSLER